MVAGPRRIDLAKIMTMSPNTPDLDALLAHSGWVRALAQNLVSDPATADDVAQQAWQTALERPPRHGSNLRSWWSSVVRSSAGKGWREQASRQRLERKLQTREPSRAPDRPEELAERLDTFQRLASAVAQLPEPYGSAIYLRFFEELSVKEVATRQGLPLATAQSHITRGLERLRGALHKDLGEEWRHRCLLFAVPMQAAPWLSLGPLTILAMNTKTTLSLAAGLLALLTLFLWNPWAAEDLPQDHSQLAAGTYEAEGGSSQATPHEAGALNAADLIREDIPLAPAAVAEGMVAVHIRDAVTLEAVPNAVVHYLPYSTWKEPEVERIMREEKPGPYERITRYGEPFQADASGVLQLPAPDQRFSIVAENGESFGYRWFFDPAEVSQGFEILLYPEIQVTVEVRDGNGNPVEGAAVGFNHAPFAYTNSPSLQVTTDANGKATFAHLELETSDHPERPGSFALLVPSAPAQRFEVAAADLPGAHLQFVMPQTGTVQIEAVDGSGFPLDNGTPVVLQLADQIARTVANGGSQEARNRFSMKLSESMQVAYVRDGIATFTQVGIGTELAAASYDDEANGYAVAIVQGPRHAGDVVKATLGLSKAPGELRFRLVNADGEHVELPKGHSVVISGVDQKGHSFGHGASPNPLENGAYRVPLSEREMTAKEVWIATFPLDRGNLSLLEYGFLLIDTRTDSWQSEVLEIPFATDLLVNATLVTVEGNPYPNQVLHWELIRNDEGMSMRIMERWDTFRANQKGDFQIWGPPAVMGYQYRLGLLNEGQKYWEDPEFLHFEIGAHKQKVVTRQEEPISGRLVVDDPMMLKDLRIHLQTIGPNGKISQEVKIEMPNGRFVLPKEIKANSPLQLNLFSPYIKTVVSSYKGIQSIITRVDGRPTIPDWDLRGKLFANTVVAKSPDGKIVQPIFLNDSRLGGLPEGAKVISDKQSTPVWVQANGYMRQLVYLQGDTTVILATGPLIQVELSAALPEARGIKWVMHLLPVESGYIQRNGYGRRTIPIADSRCQFRLSRLGDWALAVQAVPKNKEFGFGSNGGCRFDNGELYTLVEFSDIQDHRVELKVQPEALQAALDEALAEAGLSED